VSPLIIGENNLNHVSLTQNNNSCSVACVTKHVAI